MLLYNWIRQTTNSYSLQKENKMFHYIHLLIQNAKLFHSHDFSFILIILEIKFITILSKDSNKLSKLFFFF